MGACRAGGLAGSSQGNRGNRPYAGAPRGRKRWVKSAVCVGSSLSCSHLHPFPTPVRAGVGHQHHDSLSLSPTHIHTRAHTHTHSYVYVHGDFITGHVRVSWWGWGRAGGKKERELPWGLSIEKIGGSSWWTVQGDLGDWVRQIYFGAHQ